MRRQNRKIGEFCELLIRDMTLTHVYRRENQLTILDDPAHLSPKPSHQSQPHTFPECEQVLCAPVLPPVADRLPLLSLTSTPHQAGRQQTPGLLRRRCHPATAKTPLLPPLLLSTSNRPTSGLCRHGDNYNATFCRCLCCFPSCRRRRAGRR
jgi:hypothetical protein